MKVIADFILTLLASFSATFSAVQGKWVLALIYTLAACWFYNKLERNVLK